MHNRYRQQLKTYDIHPISIKQIQKGHPWVTMDKFSEKFHPKEKFIVAANRSRPFALLIHDPTHKSVRARVWATKGDFGKQMKSFKNDLGVRIQKAIQKRLDSKVNEKRNNFYLIFGEGDDIPGLFVQFLNGEILIQFYMDFWNQYKDYIVQTIIKKINDTIDPDLYIENCWLQVRSDFKNAALSMDPNCSFRSVEVSEYDVKYKVTLGKYYDHGLYTDMSSVRGRIKDELKKANSVLNLYSYTGAFSLYAMSLGVDEVVSVDLSEKYIEWLEENIKINKEFDAEKHTSMTTDTQSALKEMVKAKKKFDFIISDPPSSSSDKNKRTNSLSDYKVNLPLINKLLTDEGKALIFLNTHKVSMKKFEERIKQIIESDKLKLSLQKKFYLAGDCPTIKGFPEGNYLKGILLKRND